MTSPFGTPPSGDPSGSLPPPPPGGPIPGSPPPPPSPSRPITEEVPVTPGPARGAPPQVGEPGTDSPWAPGRGSTQVVDGPLRSWTPPNPLDPVDPPTEQSGANPPWWVIAAVVGGAVVACYVVWLLTNTWLRNAYPDGRGYWVPAVALAVSGGLWGLLMGGPDALKRAGFGTAAGAVAGVVGSLVFGSTETHLNAFDNAIVSGASLLRALGWGAFTAAAWAATLGAGTVRSRMSQVGAGAAVGGFATGATMGLLAGTNVFGSGTRVWPTDLWWSVPIRDVDAELTVLPLLLVAIGVPVTLAAVNRTAVAAVGRPLALGAVASLLVPIIGGAAGYASDLDSARRDGPIAVGEIPEATLPDIAVPTLPDISVTDSGLPTLPADSSPATSEPSAPSSAAPAGAATTEPAGTADTTETTDTTESTDTTGASASPSTTSAGTDPGASSPVSVPADSAPADSTTVAVSTTSSASTTSGATTTPTSTTSAASTTATGATTTSTPGTTTTSAPTVDSTVTESTPAGSDPSGPGDTVAVPFDAGIPFTVAFTGTATNDVGEVAEVLVAVGEAAPPADADEIWPGPSTCATEGSAVIPFIIQVTTTEPAVTYVDVRFSQGAVDADAAVDHPMTIEFHDADGTTRCTDATAADTSNTAAFTAWPAQSPDAPSFAYGYFIVEGYFADGEPIGEPAAVVAVVPIVNQVVTSTAATVEGAAPVDFTDPTSGEPSQALDLVP